MNNLILNIYNTKTKKYVNNITTEEFFKDKSIKIPFTRTLVGVGKSNGNYEFVFKGLADFKLEILGDTFDKLIENLFNDYTKINSYDFRLLYIHNLINFEESVNNENDMDFNTNKDITKDFAFINNVCNTGLVINEKIIDSTHHFGISKKKLTAIDFLTPYGLREYDKDNTDKKLKEFYEYIKEYDENIIPHYNDEGFIEYYEKKQEN